MGTVEIGIALGVARGVAIGNAMAAGVVVATGVAMGVVIFCASAGPANTHRAKKSAEVSMSESGDVLDS